MAGTTAVAGLATALWNKLLKTPVPAVAPRVHPQPVPGPRLPSPAAAPSADPSPAATVVLRGPIAPPARPGRIVGPAPRLPDTFILLDETVLAAIQHDRTVMVHAPGGRSASEGARVWWRHTLRWLTARRDLSLALTALDPLGPGQRACAAVEPWTGLVSRDGTRSRHGCLDLRDLVRGPGSVSEVAAARAADRALNAFAGHRPAPAGARLRIVLVRLHPALRRLGVQPARYAGLRLTERLIRTACRALEEALARRPALAGATRAEPRPWPSLTCDLARLRRGRLTVLSPYEFLPPSGEDTRAWIDLLPAIRLVDAVGWRRPRALPGCGPEELAALYRLTWAVRRAGGA